MIAENLDEHVLDIYDIEDIHIRRVDYLQYIDYFRRKENGENTDDLQIEMEKAGLDSSVLVYDVDNIEFYNIPYDVVIHGDSSAMLPVAISTPTSAPAVAASAPATCQHHYVKMVDYAYSKKFKAVSMGQPIEQVKMRMEMEGMDPSVLDLDMNTVGFLNIPEGELVKYPDGHTEPCCSPDAAPTPASAPATCQHHYVKMVDYAYSKKFKAVSMGQPIEQVKMRMEMEGMDPSVLDLDMNTVGFLNIPEGELVKYPDGHTEPCCSPDAAPTPASAPATCQHHYVKMVDYAYSKKFKAVSMGQPIEQVKMRMEMEGMDPSVLDLDMNTVGFLNIPEGELVKYPDGHTEPCCSSSAPAVSAPVPVPTASAAPVPLTASSSSLRTTVVKKETKPKDEILPPRPKFKHDAKLRPLYWDVLSSKTVVEKSMWFSLNDRDIQLDTAMLDMEFSTKQITFVLPSEPVNASEKVVNLLDPKREQNVGIAIGRLKITVRDLHHALLFGDFNILTKELVSLLVNAAPTPEEQEVCLAFQGDEKKLSSASLFAYELSDIPSVLQRLQCCKSILTFEDENERIRKITEVYEKNEKLMMNSSGIKKLMEIILAVGNYLNGESIRGGAWGFSINLLPKLSQTKSSDGTKTLLT